MKRLVKTSIYLAYSMILLFTLPVEAQGFNPCNGLSPSECADLQSYMNRPIDEGVRVPPIQEWMQNYRNTDLDRRAKIISGVDFETLAAACRRELDANQFGRACELYGTVINTGLWPF